MIRVFENPQSAISFALEYNQTRDETMALLQQGIAHWINNDQVLFFPVLLLEKLSVMDCLNLFHRDLQYEIPEMEIVKETLDALCTEYSDCRILSIGQWSMQIWIPSTDVSAPRSLIDRLEHSNRKIAKSLGTRWGRMGAVAPQPDRFHCQKRVFKLGIQ